MILIIIEVIILCFVSFIIGAVWLNTKHTKMGINARFICNKCKAYDCQAKWCWKKRRQYQKGIIKEKEIEENDN